MIEVKNLSKVYSKVIAAKDVNLVAKPGEITVLLGPNGAGKSTTIKSITNLLEYSGEVLICGYKNDTIEAKQSFAYVPEMPILYDLLTVEEHIQFISKAYQCKDNEHLIEHYLEVFSMTENKKKLARELSKGMKQKLSVLLALIIQPKALLVDEPLIGLDPSSIEQLLEVMVQLKQEGCAILISTHIIDVIEDMYDKAYIMNKGHIILETTKAQNTDQSLKDIFLSVIEEQ